VSRLRHFVKIFTGRESRDFLEKVEKQWGAAPELDFAFLQTQKEKIYMISKSLGEIDASKLRIDTLGLYFAELKHNELRLSIEGSQLVGPSATKNVVELDKDEFEQWLKGNDVVKQADVEGFVLIKHGNYFAGTGKYRDGVILNFVPKARRLMVSELP
jgi:NOL1/NOP2/fmu family ribosome biogenesis protein